MIFENFLSNGEFLKDGIVLKKNVPIGVIAPTTLVGKDSSGNSYISGRKGILKIEGEAQEAFWSALISSDSILFGTPHEVRCVNAILKNPGTSRTAAYVSTLSGGCKELIRRIENLRSSKILLVGCGGIGALAAMNMVGAGVAEITLVDHDVIEESNLNRQFFWRRCDVGRYKTEVLKSVISQRWPNAKVNEFRNLSMKDIKELLAKNDAAIITADEPLGLAAEIAQDSPIFVASGAYFHGYLGCFAKKPGSSSQKLLRPDRVMWARSPNFIAPSSGPGNTEIAGVVSSLCMHYLMDKEFDREFFVNKTWKPLN